MATITKLPLIDSVPSISTEQRVEILDLLFEPSVSLHNLALPILTSQTFSSYPDLIAGVGVRVSSLADSSSTSDTSWLLDILGSHPRLGAKKVDSAQSAAEQAQLKGSAKEAERLSQLNARYEAKFPGLRYVVFVNGRSREVIMKDMEDRIASSSFEQERDLAVRVSLVQALLQYFW